MNRRGFTIIELVIVITIMGILMTLGVVNLRSSQANSRDTERRLDIDTIAQHLESYYSSGADDTVTKIDCTGGNVTHDGAYTVHKFTASGTLVCTSTFTATALVVGGGGGGGGGEINPAGDAPGGGGGGGVIYNSSLSITPQAYTITVGDGGAGATGSSLNGTVGSNSTFSTLLTAYGGGYGSREEGNGGNGGSGGGAGGSCSTGDKIGGTGTAGQGYSGGNNTDAACTYRSGSGGGGAGGVGNVNLSNGGGGAGGVGISNSISGSAVSYAGGGGGGAGRNVGVLGGAGQAGGGGGGSSPNGVGGNATANSGSGGGGAGSGTNVGGAGGSGIVVVRYLTPMGIGTYPSTTTLFSGTPTLTSIKLALRDVDPDSLIAPGLADVRDDDATIAAHVASTFIAATNNTPTTADVLPQPTFSQYVYQPLHSDGSLCNDTAECRKFNLYYRSEVDNSVNMVSSVNQ